jgi:hypothetical protein
MVLPGAYAPPAVAVYVIRACKLPHPVKILTQAEIYMGTCYIIIFSSYGLDSSGSIPGRERFFSSPQRPDQLWGPESLL